MTLNPYDPAMLDHFALRLLDLAAEIRHMAQASREHAIDDFTLHDKKALEWISNLERWVRKAAADLEMRVIESRASRRAMTHRE
jgi:hypothetical protein